MSKKQSPTRDAASNPAYQAQTRFSYVKYDDVRTAAQQDFKNEFERLERLVEKHLKPDRAQELCLTALEVAYMWTGKQLRDQQIEADGGKVVEQAERGVE